MASRSDLEQFTAEEMAQLKGFGECFIHVHPKEILGFADRLELMAATPVITVTTTTYTPTAKDEIILVDTTAGSVTVTLPVANKGREFQVVKVAGPNTVFVAPSGSDTIIGSAMGVSFASLYTSLHFKGILGTGYILL